MQGTNEMIGKLLVKTGLNPNVKEVIGKMVRLTYRESERHSSTFVLFSNIVGVNAFFSGNNDLVNLRIGLAYNRFWAEEVGCLQFDVKFGWSLTMPPEGREFGRKLHVEEFKVLD